MAGFTVAIVGRPNVGKSTLFNRLLEERKAIVHDYSGVTRDRQYGIANWNGRTFNVIDTGGFVDESKETFEIEIAKQVRIAMDEADLLMFVTDVTTGITGQDEDMAAVLRKSRKPVLLVVNKVDNGTRSLDAAEFYSLGIEHLYEVSSISGSGTGDLLDEVTKRLEEKLGPVSGDEQETQRSEEDVVDEVLEAEDWDTDEEEGEEELDPEIAYEELDAKVEAAANRRLEGDAGLPKFAIIGQPNAGKSTLLNALVGHERTIVSAIAGTTRDTIHTHYRQFGQEFVLIDTAGIRKKKSVHEDLEFYSVIRAIRAMDEADVCLLLIDATIGVTAQDVSIFSLAARKGKGVVVLVNKWDLVAEKQTNSARDYEKALKENLKPFTDVPVLFVSAQEKQRIFQAIEKALQVYQNRHRRVSTRELNAKMLPEIAYYAPPMQRGKSIKIKYCAQLPTAVPSFAFFANHPKDVKTPYRNFLENKLRHHFEFTGVPVRVFFRQK